VGSAIRRRHESYQQSRLRPSRTEGTIRRSPARSYGSRRWQEHSACSVPAMRSFGIYYDDPSATPVEALRSEACITVPGDWAPSGDLERREIRGGRYAVALHVGPYAELGRVYTWLYGT
jgi:GyrI-like small molecule binding domain